MASYKRFEELEDYIKMICLKCGSDNIELEVDECPEFGNHFHSICKNCKAEYKYHNFKQVEVVTND